MPRPGITSGQKTALQSGYIIPAVFVEAHFNGGIAYVWSGVGTIVWNSQTWYGVGTLGSISTIEEAGKVQAKGIILTMSGIDPTMLAEAMQSIQLGLPVVVYFGLFDGASPPNLIDTPIKSWAGRMDQPTAEIGGETVTISIQVESRLMDLNTACDRRYTADDQAIDAPGDQAFNWVNSIQGQNIYWGRVPSST